MKKTLTRCAVLAVALPMSAVMAAPAEAGSRWTYRSSGHSAEASWIEFGPIPGVGGNAHVGNLWVDASGEAWGDVLDWTCPEGELPPTGGGHGEEEPETNCVLESTRFVYGDDSTLDFVVDKKLTTARLTGTLTVENHDGGVTASPPVDMTWTGFGDVSTYTYYESGSSGGSSFVYKTTSDSRDATISGRIGAMGFTDDADDTSQGSFRSYKTYEKVTTD